MSDFSKIFRRDDVEYCQEYIDNFLPVSYILEEMGWSKVASQYFDGLTLLPHADSNNKNIYKCYINDLDLSVWDKYRTDISFIEFVSLISVMTGYALYRINWTCVFVNKVTGDIAYSTTPMVTSNIDRSSLYFIFQYINNENSSMSINTIIKDRCLSNNVPESRSKFVSLEVTVVKNLLDRVYTCTDGVITIKHIMKLFELLRLTVTASGCDMSGISFPNNILPKYMLPRIRVQELAFAFNEKIIANIINTHGDNHFEVMYGGQMTWTRGKTYFKISDVIDQQNILMTSVNRHKNMFNLYNCKLKEIATIEADFLVPLGNTTGMGGYYRFTKNQFTELPEYWDNTIPVRAVELGTSGTYRKLQKSARWRNYMIEQALDLL